jgi:hypothetical protein
MAGNGRRRKNVNVQNLKFRKWLLRRICFVGDVFLDVTTLM